MGKLTIVNDTQVPLHVALKHISPLHFANSIPPNGGSQTLKPGSVWFTIEVRIDRGDNDYTLWETYVPIAAVTLGVLSLGAGAVYIAGASAAAGGTSAAIAAISARVGAQVASSAPTVRRLYRYARKGQKIVQVGQVIGIGGGAAAGKLLGAKGQPGKESTSADEGEAQGKGGLAKWRQDRRETKGAKKVLKSLLEGSVLTSHGWLMRGTRVIRIVGGPRASEVEGYLVIETDTVQPFELVDESGRQGPALESAASTADGKALDGSHSSQGGAARLLRPLRRAASAPDAADAQEEDVDGLEKLSPDELKRNLQGTSAGATGFSVQTVRNTVKATLNDGLQRGSTILSRLTSKKDPKDRADGVSATIADNATFAAEQPSDSAPPVPTRPDLPNRATAPARGASRSPARPLDHVPHASSAPQLQPTPQAIILDMGFSEEQAERALKTSSGDVALAIEWLFETEDKKVPWEEGIPEHLDAEEEALDNVPTDDEAERGRSMAGKRREEGKAEATSSTLSAPAESGAASSSTSASTSPAPSTPATPATPDVAASGPSAKKSLPVKGAEHLETPHWTKRALTAAEQSGAASLLKLGSDHVVGLGTKWLEKDDKKSKGALTSSSTSTAKTTKKK